MATGDADLDAFIERIRKIQVSIVEEVAREAASLVQVESKRTAAAGTTPDGKPWAPRRDGKRAIPDAASAVDVVARAGIILIRVFRGAALQNSISEKYRRQVIPDGGSPLPQGIVDALKDGASRAFKRLTGG